MITMYDVVDLGLSIWFVNSLGFEPCTMSWFGAVFSVDTLLGIGRHLFVGDLKETIDEAMKGR